jgi:NADPH-dependent 2,4-dienoyl-CoA reductase/sulfur reductase-like enzyme/peroxiredoxin family protein/TusA-related sulfurtransferase/rhodanese-related sulfurtransferase
MSKNKRIIIIGGVGGGASAATRARRLDENASIIIFDRGEHISFANCGLPYHIGGAIKERESLLVQTPQGMKERFNIDVHIKTEIIKIDREAKEVIAREIDTGKEYARPYDKLILSPGATPFVPEMEGTDHERAFTLRSIEDMDLIKNVIDKQNPSSATVVGGGFIGLEMAEALVERGLKVSLIEAMDQVFTPFDKEMAAPIHKTLALNGVDLHLASKLQRLVDSEGGLEAVMAGGKSIKSDIVILAIGVRPETTLASAAGLDIGKCGGIAVDTHLRTSDENIYAIGDAIEVTDFVSGNNTLIPLAGPANRQGRIAADNALGGQSEYKGTQGTSVCKIFNITAGSTGLNEKTLKRIGRPYEKIYIHPTSNASYYPGAAAISVKLLFDPQSGLVLGAQAVGSKGVDKRIDVFATAIRAKMTVFDLSELELSYAPPYGSAKDPVNYAGFVAANVIKGDMPVCHSEDMIVIRSDQVALDIRPPEELYAATIPGAVNIPVDELRERLDELPRDKELLVLCKVGLKGYAATRLLMQKGFKCRNLSGGITSYNDFTFEAGKEAASHNAKTPDSVKGKDNMTNIIKEIDACGLQCPGPVMKLKKAIDQIEQGQSIAITSTDPGFASDIPAWCSSTGNTLEKLAPEKDGYKAVITKGAAKAVASAPQSGTNAKTMVVFSNDFDKAMASFIIANGAASTGSEVTMFFTFWGLNLLRKKQPVDVKKNLIEKMFGFMMPRGPEKTSLSKMNMCGIGTIMIKGIMKKKNVSSLTELIDNARSNGVRMVACAMSMDLMGIKPEELIEGVEQGGVAMYLEKAENANVNLFI